MNEWGEWARLYYELSNDELFILRGLALVAKSKRGTYGRGYTFTKRLWVFAPPIIIGERRSVTEPVVLERRAA